MDKARALMIFTRVARLGSFRKAAAELGLTPQAVSRSVDTLESVLGSRLLARTTRSVGLTQEGSELLGRAEEALAQLDEVLRSSLEPLESVSGPVRIAAPLDLGREFITPLSLELKRRHPLVIPELVLQDGISDIVAERIDVAIRAGKVPDSRLVARKVAPIQLMVCASPIYLRKHGCPAQWEALRHHQLTGFRSPRTGKLVPWERQGAQGEVGYDEFDLAFVANETSAELQAILAGVGIGQLAGFTAIKHLRSGKLKLLFPEAITEQYALYVVYAQRARMPLRVRTAVDFLIERLSHDPNLRLSGAEAKQFAALGAKGVSNRGAGRAR
jgi:DNA-binding transcriptional LysR family regulator